MNAHVTETKLPTVDSQPMSEHNRGSMVSWRSPSLKTFTS